MNDDPFSAGPAGMDQLSAYFTAWGRAIQQAVGIGPGQAGNQGQDAAGGPWLQAIFELARQGVEQGLDSAGLAAAWREILRQGLWPDAVPAAATPGAMPWLELPAFGPWREHVDRWQQQARQYGQAQAGLGQWQSVMQQVREAALGRFEALLRDHEADPLADVRALLDLWIEAAEQAWEEHARAPEFAQALAGMNQAQLEAWQASQAEMQRGLAAMGLATRTELDQAWQRIDALERQLAALLSPQGQHGVPKAAARKRAAPAARPASAPGKRGRDVPASTSAAKAPPAGRSRKTATAAGPGVSKGTRSAGKGRAG